MQAGQTYGEWRVIDASERDDVLVRCSCGIVRRVRGRHLRHGASRSCGHRTRPPIREATPAEIAWVAGVFEGEGYFLARGLAIGMTDRDVLSRIALITGTKAPRGPYHYRSATRANCKPFYRWSVGAQQAAELLREMLPWLGERRKEQAAARGF